MTTRRELILTALIAQLNQISVANGYRTNVAASAGGGGAQKAGNPHNSLDLLPTVVAGFLGENKREARHSAYECDLRFAVACYPAVDGTTSTEDLVETILEDVESVLLAQANADPPLGVLGVQALNIDGHDRIPFDDEAHVAALVEGTIIYRHNVDSSAAFGAGG